MKMRFVLNRFVDVFLLNIALLTLTALICCPRAEAQAFDFRTVGTATWTRYDFRGSNGSPATACTTNWGCMAYDYSQQKFICSTNGSSWAPCTFGSTGGGSGVTSFNARTGAVIPILGDYTGSLITITAPGSGITSTNVQGALNQLAARSAGVSSFNARTGAVVPTSGDYSVGMVTGAAPLASPTFTGTPTAPTATVGTSTTQLATTAFVAGAITGAGPCATCVTTNTSQTISADKTITTSTTTAQNAFKVTTPSVASPVTVTAGTNTVTGSGTTFTTTYVVGSPIVVSGQTRYVSNVVSDTSMLVATNWTSSCSNCAVTYAPLSALAVRNSGDTYLGGALRLTNSTPNQNFLELPLTSTAVGAVAMQSPTLGGFRLFADTTGRFAWIGSNGFVRTFDGTGMTASHTYTLPDLDGTVTVLGNGTTGTGSIVRDTNATMTTPTLNGSTLSGTVAGTPTFSGATITVTNTLKAGFLGVNFIPVTARFQSHHTSVGLPAQTGTTDGSINTRMSQSGGAGVIDFGWGGTAGGGGYIQSRSSANLATNFSMLLQPNGGGITIGGRTDPQATALLDVRGPIFMVGTAPPTFATGAWIWAESGVGLGIQGGGTLRLRSSGSTTDALTIDASQNTVLSGTLKERGRTVAMGEWTTFTPTLTAATGTWTGGTVNYAKYMLVGKTMTIALDVFGTSVSATPANLSVAIPGGFTSAGPTGNSGSGLDNGVTSTVWAISGNASATTISIFKTVAGGGAWATSTANTRVGFELVFEVQ